MSLVLIGVCALSACDDYFNPAYTGNISEEGYYDNMNNLRFGLNAVYNVLQSKDYQVSELLFGEAVSDNMWCSQDVTSGAVYDVLNFVFTTDNSYILTRYRTNYEAINKANQVIRNIDKVKAQDISSTQKEIREVYGQAKVLRALCYFNLVRTFGGVSIQPEHAELSELCVPRSSEEETYAYIEKDLRESLLLLRKQRYMLDECGQIDMSGALGLLLKVLLYESSPGIRTSETVKAAKWQEAKAIGEFFLDGTRDLTFAEALNFNEQNYPEETWEQLSKRLMIDPIYNMHSTLAAAEVVNQHSLIAFDQIYRVAGEFSPESLIEINHYDFAGSGSSADESWKLYDNMLDGGSPIYATCAKAISSLMTADPRKVFSITEAQNKDAYISQEETPMFTKGVGDKLLFSKYYVFPSEGSHGCRNYRIMRYAEALLIYAEVLNETGETEKAVQYVNRVRDRARKLFSGTNARFITNCTEASFKDIAVAPQDVVREAILKEKRIEMAGEYDRWYEVCRLDQCADCMAFQANNRPVESSGNVRIRGLYFKKGINERFPIPQKEIFISNGVIEQNPGY